MTHGLIVSRALANVFDRLDEYFTLQCTYDHTIQLVGDRSPGDGCESLCRSVATLPTYLVTTGFALPPSFYWQGCHASPTLRRKFVMILLPLHLFSPSGSLHHFIIGSLWVEYSYRPIRHVGTSHQVET